MRNLFSTYRHHMKYVIPLLVVAIVLAAAQITHAQSQNRFFQIESIDTMKFSRDAARDPNIKKMIPQLVERAASLHPTHIAVATPYDDEFLPVLQLWVSEIHKRNIKVWYRGNFSAWEGWFDYPEFKNQADHLKKTEDFIKKNPDLFEDGDIFTPAPEPENGTFGDPRKSEANRKKFFDFLPKSHDACVRAAQAIHRDLKCGYFSVNGDVARMFTREDVQKLDNVLVIDHYVKTPEKLISDIRALHETTGATIILGEYGAPIPDIHGDLTENQQNDLIKQNLIALVKNRDIVGGINYWTAFGGSTEIFKNESTPKKAAITLKNYFDPIVIHGHIEDEFSHAVANVVVQTPLTSTKSDNMGNYSLMTTSDYLTLAISKPDYRSTVVNVYPKTDTTQYEKNIQISAERHDIGYYVRRIWGSIISFTHF